MHLGMATQQESDLLEKLHCLSTVAKVLSGKIFSISFWQTEITLAGQITNECRFFPVA
jgi:hypothetical protein